MLSWDGIESFIVALLFASDGSVLEHEQFVTMIGAAAITAAGIAGLIAVCVWPLEGESIWPRSQLRDDARNLPKMPAGSIERRSAR